MAGAVMFDLDGTLTDSSEGIFNSVRLALDHYGITYDEHDLRLFIGPPLGDSFYHAGIDQAHVDDAIRIFRERYNVIGKYENRPYEGISELLARLKEAGIHLYVATSKPEKTAIDILKKFQLASYFDEIAGATFDHSRESKESVIAYLLEKMADTDEIVMVGDTHYDIEGAHYLRIPSIGVSWGFGDVQEMIDAQAYAIADTTDELYDLIMERGWKDYYG